MEAHAAGTVSWLDLMTTDVEAASKFYGELFGRSCQAGPPETGGYVMALKDGAPAAGIGKKPDDAPYPPAWTVYFAVDDVAATVKAVEGAGGQTMVPPMDVLSFGKMAICVDASGAHFGLWQAGDHKGAGIQGEAGAMGWTEVNVPDAEKGAAFYGSVFRHTVKPMEAPGMVYKTLHLGDDTVAGVLQMDEQWEGIPPHWMSYFCVENTDESVETLKRLGGSLKHGPFDTPFGRVAVVADPQGAHFSIIQPPAKG